MPKLASTHSMCVAHSGAPPPPPVFPPPVPLEPPVPVALTHKEATHSVSANAAPFARQSAVLEHWATSSS